MKKVSVVLALTLLVVLATAGSAFANFGPHGAYSLDTDACAGCHRAHTSFSTLTWNDGVDDRSALLVSSASTMQEFCYACHGDAAPGASTNVEVGVFDSGPSGADNVALGGAILYQTNSSFDATLNGGAFSGVSSMHDMDKGAVTDPMWGAGTSAPDGTDLACTSCHDVHGSSNYRLLKDSVNGVTVGGYDVSDNPQGYVFSSEEGYPAVGSGGWLKHEPGAAQMVSYRPNYTAAQYLYEPTAGSGVASPRTMSTWCSACHTEYDNLTSAYDYEGYESNGTLARDAGTGELTVTGATQFVGALTRHRHPVNTPVGSANTINGFGTNSVTSTVLPLEKTSGSIGDEVGAYRMTDIMGCLTCHRAHGSDAEMTGWANSRLIYSASGVNTWSVEPTTVAPAGVNPNVSSALLRADNRGVCERCHNK